MLQEQRQGNKRSKKGRASGDRVRAWGGHFGKKSLSLTRKNKWVYKFVATWRRGFTWFNKREGSGPVETFEDSATCWRTWVICHVDDLRRGAWWHVKRGPHSDLERPLPAAPLLLLSSHPRHPKFLLPSSFSFIQHLLSR